MSLTDQQRTIKTLYWWGVSDPAAHSAAYLVRQGNIDPRHSIQIVMRGKPRTRDWLEPSDDHGY